MTAHSRRAALTMLAAAASMTAGCTTPDARERLSVFDALVEALRKHYFDQSALDESWRNQVRRARALAAQAPDRAALYLDVLQPLLEQLDASHIQLNPPANSLSLPAGRSFRLPAQRRGQRPYYLTDEDEAGLGARFAWDGERTIVVEVAPDGVAAQAGVNLGDPLLFRRYRRTPAGGELSVIDHRTNHDLKLIWTRRKATPMESRSLGDGLVHIRFDRFDASSIDQVLALLAAHPVGAILDLRTNEGGLIQQVHRLLSALLPAGQSLGDFINASGGKTLRSSGNPRPYAGRLLTLIGMRSMSGAEVTASCLRHYRRSQLIGQRTAGAVLASLSYPLPDGGRLGLPYADYRDPFGRRIESIGVAPDVETALVEDISLPKMLQWLQEDKKR